MITVQSMLTGFSLIWRQKKTNTFCKILNWGGGGVHSYYFPGPCCWSRAQSRAGGGAVWPALIAQILGEGSEEQRQGSYAGLQSSGKTIWISGALEGWDTAEDVRWNTFSFRSVELLWNNTSCGTVGSLVTPDSYFEKSTATPTLSSTLL